MRTIPSIEHTSLLENDLVESWPIERLQPAAANPGMHSEEQIGQIAASMLRFGFTNPVLVGRSGEIIAGHGRVAAARQLRWQTVPVLRFAYFTEADCLIYSIAENWVAEAAGWDRELVVLEFRYLMELIIYHLQVVNNGENMRLMVSLPPRSSKSNAAALLWARRRKMH